MQPALKHTQIEESHNFYILRNMKRNRYFSIFFYTFLKFHEIFHVKIQNCIYTEILPPWVYPLHLVKDFRVRVTLWYFVLLFFERDQRK